MARPLRVEVPGGLHHVIARGNERKAIFRYDADRSKYLDRIAHYREKFGFQFNSARFFARDTSTMINGLNRLAQAMEKSQALRRSLLELKRDLQTERPQ